MLEKLNAAFQTQKVVLILLASSLCCLAEQTQAQIDLLFYPPNLTIETGEVATLFVVLSSAVDLRTFEATIEYDPALISSISGGAASLFTDSGFTIWDGFEEDTPGLWHGFAIVMGAYDWVTGPGDLYQWTFVGLDEGAVVLNVLDVQLYAPDAEPIDGVTLEPVGVIASETQSWDRIKSMFR